MELLWNLNLPASTERVWSLMSDTDAFNRAAGLGMRFSAADGDVRGESTFAGVTVKWQEQAFQWVEPSWFLQERAYESGPVAAAKTRCELEETPAGTQLRYRVELLPRAAWWTPAVMGLGNLVIRPKLETAFRAVEGALRGTIDDWDPPPRLDAEALLRLDARLRWVPERVADALRRRIVRAPLPVQFEFNPYEIAAQEGLPADDVLEGFLLAVKSAALKLEWRVACPRCRRGEASGVPLGAGGLKGHCEVCGIRYDGGLADNVQAIFRVHPEIRPGKRPIDCMLAPGRTPHVLAQMQVASRGEVALDVRLEPGCYRVEIDGARTGSGSTTCLVEVDAEHDATEAVVVVGNTVEPAQVALAPGPVVLRIANRTPRSLQVGLVRRWRPALMCSAARVLAHPAARERIPDALLVPGLGIRAQTGWALVAHAPDEWLDAVLPTLSAVRVDRQGTRVAVLFSERPEDLMRCAEALVRGGGPVGMGLAYGVVVRFEEASRVGLGGAAVDHAMRLVERVGRPRVAVSLPDLERLEAALSTMRVAVARRDDRALLVFSAMLEAPDVGPAAAEPAGEDDAPTPTHVGPYHVIRELDRGGMGMVLDCVDPGGQRVAVKVVLPDFHTSEKLTQRFFNEAWYASRVVHPNLVRVLDFGMHETRPWLAMELLSGITLQKHLTQVKRMTPAATLEVLRGVLGGLSALHEGGLVHRDLKPANVMMLQQTHVAPGGVKLLDFGLVRRGGRHPDEGLMGTPDYMAPEQLLGDTIGPATDVYATGVMAYRMVTGRLPFRGDPSKRVTGRVTADVGDLPDLALLGPVEPLVRAALAPLAERPASAEALMVYIPG